YRQKEHGHADTTTRTAAIRSPSAVPSTSPLVGTHAGAPGVELPRLMADAASRGGAPVHDICGASSCQQCDQNPYRRRGHFWGVFPPFPVAASHHSLPGSASVTSASATAHTCSPQGSS